MIILQEHFNTPTLDPRLQWFSPPLHWRIEPGVGHLVIEPEAKTDFWQNTHYGFQADNGHFLFHEAAGDITLTVVVSMKPLHQYDQAGAMIRYSADCWIKTSIEYEEDGLSKLGAVVTNHGYSDWSTQDFRNIGSPTRFRMQRQGNDYQISCSVGYEDNSWSQLRVTHLAHPPQAAVQYGLYTCCPTASGLQVRFSSLTLGG